MKTIVTVAAFAAFFALTAAGSASAATYQLPANEIEICRTLELAHESSCAEYEANRVRQLAATGALDASETTGSIALPTVKYIPYLNGVGDPDGLTLSSRPLPGADEITGSISPGRTDYIPYLNGAGDPDGLTLSNPRPAASTGTIR